MQKNNKKILVGMSGGVDSSVAALLLLQAGYTVEGVFMKNWDEDDATEHCTASVDVADAQQVCDRLGIRLHTVNFAAEYWDRVFSHFLDEFKAGRTPNPDILCNREIKFKIFLEYAQNLGADYIATGHYAAKFGADGLAKASDRDKDQSYFLYALTADQLRNALFPLAALTKPQVRALAAQAGFANHRKKDSTGICFIGERKFKEFLQNYLPAQPGTIVTDNGTVLGEHDGLMFYTIGQRQGLKIGGRANAANEPWFVIDKDLRANQLIVAQGQDHPRLYANSLIAQQLTWVPAAPLDLEFRCTAKIRYRQSDQACKLSINPDNNSCNVIFDQPQRAITPGQSIVFYQDDRCLGGGIIQERYCG